MTSPCKEEVLLSAYLDGELPGPQSDAVARHLESCPRCRQTLASLKHTDEMVRGLPPLEPSARFDRTFWQQVGTLEKRQKRYAWLRYLFSGWRPVLAGGLAGIVAVVIYISGNKALSPEEMFIAEHMELLEDFDMIGNLEMLEHWESIEAMRDQT
ncbi:MAG: zf-HC2 domain-containing protein [Desulfobacteraceae bacterium]|jgi:anti-sigma factor RsiW